MNQITNDKALLSKRLGAFFIDYVILCFIMVVIAIMGGNKFFDTAMVIAFIFWLLKDSDHGISIGKKFLKIAIREEQDNNKVPGFLKLVIRNLFTFLLPIELIIMLVDKDHRRLGDILTGTEVVLINKEK